MIKFHNSSLGYCNVAVEYAHRGASAPLFSLAEYLSLRNNVHFSISNFIVTIHISQSTKKAQ